MVVVGGVDVVDSRRGGDLDRAGVVYYGTCIPGLQVGWGGHSKVRLRLQCVGRRCRPHSRPEA